MVALSARECPECGRRVREPFKKTILGREVCPDCAKALFMGAAMGAAGGGAGVAVGVWAMLKRKIRRSS